MELVNARRVLDDHDIEIEVYADHAPESDGDEVPPAEARGDEIAPSLPDRRRLIAATSVVGVAALAVGWLIGSWADSDDEADPTGVTITATTEASLPSEELPLPSTTRPQRSTTTTTLAPRTIEAVRIDARLAGVESELVGLETTSGHLWLVELDLAEQTVTRSDAGFLRNIEAMLAGDDWVILFSGSGSAMLVRDGEEAEPLPVDEPWEVRWQRGTDRFWHQDWSEDSWGWNGPTAWEEIDITGQPTGNRLELPLDTWVELVDPRGGLVVQATGKYYSVDEAGASLIGTGELMGLSTDTAVFWDCDDQLDCGLSATDRDTGVVRDLRSDELGSGVHAVEPLWGWGGERSGSISPDDEICAVLLMPQDRRDVPAIGLIDLESGDVVELATSWDYSSPTIAWSPGARFAFFPHGDGSDGGDGELWAYDRESGATFSVFDEPRSWGTFTTRPADPGASSGAAAGVPTPIAWGIDLDDLAGIHTVSMVVDFGPMAQTALEQVSGRLVWEETSVELCGIAIRDQVPEGHVGVGDIFQISEGCGDEPTAMQDAFAEFGLPETGCVSVVIGSIEHTFCAPFAPHTAAAAPPSEPDV